MHLKIDFQDCERELLNRTNDYGKQEYMRWLGRPDTKLEVVPFVTGFTHSHLFSVSLEEYERVVQESDHALGDVQTREQIKAVEDFTCPFAFQHIFHEYIEVNRCLPTWQSFSYWLKHEAHDKYVAPLLAKLGHLIERQSLARAVRWRLGKAYYSAMREVELLIRLREEYGLNLRYHLLADVLLRVDFWLDDLLICVWFENPHYRSDRTGRKPKAEQFFQGTLPPFSILDVKVERQGYGNFWRVSDASCERIAQEINEARLKIT